MGDFNAANNSIVDRSNNSTEITKKTNHSWRSEISLFSYLEDLGFSDVHKDWEEMTTKSMRPSHTWKNKNASSRIDYIWINQELAMNNKLYSFNNIDFNHITNSDHTLLQLSLYRKGIVNCSSEAAIKRKGLRTILDLKRIDNKKWLKYVQ